MSTTTDVVVDDKERIALPKLAKPGDVYRIEVTAPGQIVLRLLPPGNPGPKMNYAEALKAVRSSTLDFTCGYDELRQLTREP